MQESGLEFRTVVKVDSYHPHFAYWSIDPNDPTTEREGLWHEDGYAKIKVKITYCNQFDPVYTAIEWVHPDWQVELNRFYVGHGEINAIERSSTVESQPNNECEPIDCFHYALKICTRPRFPEH